MFTTQRRVDIAARHTERRRTVRLLCGADGLWADAQQACMRQVEQHAGVVVGIDEAVFVDVVNDNGLGRIFDERAITFLVFAQSTFGLLAI